MSLITYGGLKSAVADWLHRSDLTARIPDFIVLAEARISNDLGDICLLKTEGTITTSSGVRKYAAPSGFISIRHAYRREPASTPMQIVSDRELDEKCAFEQYTSIPKFIAFDGTNFVLHPTPNGVFNIKYESQEVLPALSDSAPTNTVLTRFPGLYLWGACYEAAAFIRDAALEERAQGRYSQSLENARSVDFLGDATLRTDIAIRGGSFNFYSGD